MEISKAAAAAAIFLSFLALSFLGASSQDYYGPPIPPPTPLNRTCPPASSCSDFCYSKYSYPSGFCDHQGYCVCFDYYLCDGNPYTGKTFCDAWCVANGYAPDTSFCDEQGTCLCNFSPHVPSPSPSPSPCV
ncbi:hypothetical protein SLE2022_165210 [Rubroshorea leprosula]